MQDDANLRRLSWRCRRGLLELDVLLGNFLQQQYVRLKPQLQTAFAALLECSDQDLINWLLKEEGQPDDLAMQQIICLIRPRLR